MNGPIALGSASLDLLRQSSESLAGRIAFLELTPVHAGEVSTDRKTIDRLWLRGGFPDSLLARTDAASLAWRTAFIRTYLERDIPQFGPRVPAETLRRFWTMLANAQGQQLNAARMASGLGVSGQTVARYLDLLADRLLVRRLEPWSGNIGTRLVRSPKVYVRDSGLVHALLNIACTEDLLGHPVAGPSWEGMVIESLTAAAANAPAHFYRTTVGAEIDLVFEGRGRTRYAIEIKRSTAPAGEQAGRGIARLPCARRLLAHMSPRLSHPLSRAAKAMSRNADMHVPRASDGCIVPTKGPNNGEWVAPGMDGVTWLAFETDFETRLVELHERVDADIRGLFDTIDHGWLMRGSSSIGSQTAEQFLPAWRERLRTFGLALHPEKTRLICDGGGTIRSQRPVGGSGRWSADISTITRSPAIAPACMGSEVKSSGCGIARFDAGVSAAG